MSESTAKHETKNKGQGTPSSRSMLSNPSKNATFSSMAAPPPKKTITPEMKKSSITVTGSTRIMLNALVMLDKAETIDDLVSNVIGDYVNSELTIEEKQQYDMLVDRLRAKLNK